MTSQTPPKWPFRKAVSWLREAGGRMRRAAGSLAARDAPRKVWFHRGYKTVTGGTIKHSHYFEHVLRMPGFAPKIVLVGEPRNESLRSHPPPALARAGQCGGFALGTGAA